MPQYLIIAFSIIAALAAILAIVKTLRDLTKKAPEKFVSDFKSVRSEIKNRRKQFQNTAIQEYNKRSERRMIIQNKLPLLTMGGWILSEPREMNDTVLELCSDISPVLINNQTEIGPYKCFSDAISDLDKPKKMDRNKQYRLLKIEPDKLTFSQEVYDYFDKINVGNFLVYEYANHVINRGPSKIYDKVLNGLDQPYKSIVLAGVNTLTLLKSGTRLRFIMHFRGKDLGSSEGTYHVIPAGEFQPSCQAAISFEEDFSLWKNIMRESAEELLCEEEYDGNSGVPFNYQKEPYLTLEKERLSGNIKLFYFGVGYDPLSLQAEILTCVVYKEEVFNKIYGLPPKERNSEGVIITDESEWGREFTDKEIESYYSSNTLAAGESILRIAQKHVQYFRDLQM